MLRNQDFRVNLIPRSDLPPRSLTVPEGRAGSDHSGRGDGAQL